MTRPLDLDRILIGSDDLTNAGDAAPKKDVRTPEDEALGRAIIQEGGDALPQEMREAALNEPDKLPDGPPAKPLNETPRRTLREVMADCVSALSLGPEEIDAAEAYYASIKNPKETPKRGLREVMADGVSALSRGPEDLISLEESYGPKNKDRHRP